MSNFLSVHVGIYKSFIQTPSQIHNTDIKHCFLWLISYLDLCVQSCQIFRRKEWMRLIRIFLICFWWDTGSTKYLCVFRGRSYIIWKEIFQEFSSCTASGLKRSQIGDSENWKSWWFPAGGRMWKHEIMNMKSYVETYEM